jgi:type II secretory pathway pseudopilin PulG
MMEVVVVLAVVAALAAMIGPRVFTYLNDANLTQAQNDTRQIAGAINKFYEQVGRPPYKKQNAVVKAAAKQAGDYDCLISVDGVDFTTATDLTTGDSWTSAGGVQCQSGSTTRDTVENHLIVNNPGALGANYPYTTTGITPWKGPYLQSLPADPWGSKYLVNIGKMDPGAGKAVFVLSAGPNRNIETGSDQAVNTTFSAGGDDILSRVK